MSTRTLMALAGVMASSFAAAATATSPAVGTICVTKPDRGADEDPLAAASIDAATRTLGMRGFTILDDPAHAAYDAEVVATRAEVGTSVAQGRAGRAIPTGGGVSVPLSQGKSVLAPIQRTRVEIRIRRRGSQTVFWHGAAVTVRSVAAPDGGPDQVAFALSQAALSSYPRTAGEISVPCRGPTRLPHPMGS